MSWHPGDFEAIEVDAFDEWNLQMRCKCGWSSDHNGPAVLTELIDEARAHLNVCTYEGE